MGVGASSYLEGVPYLQQKQHQVHQSRQDEPHSCRCLPPASSHFITMTRVHGGGQLPS
jgi:hypothetical protein